jgi:hypothetical protein
MVQALDSRQFDLGWPNVQGRAQREVVTDEPMPEGTFIDCATVHILCINTVDALRSA